jgi:hypothetical protein
VGHRAGSADPHAIRQIQLETRTAARPPRRPSACAACGRRGRAPPAARTCCSLRENRRFGRWRWWKEERAALGEATAREEDCAGRGDGARTIGSGGVGRSGDRAVRCTVQERGDVRAGQERGAGDVWTGQEREAARRTAA